MSLRSVARRLACALACALTLSAGLLLAPAVPVAAGTLHVTDCGDSGASTLRGRLAAAGIGDAIVWDQDCTTTLASTLTLTQDVTVDGSGHVVILDGGCTVNCGTGSATGGVRVFQINGGVTAGISTLTIRNGNTVNFGGGINNSGTLTVTNVTLSANSSDAGGGIYNRGTLTVTNGTLSGNSVGSAAGGGIANENGLVTVTSSTLSGNGAGSGGGIYTFNGTLRLRNSIVAANTALQGPDINGAVATTGNNLVSSTNHTTGITNGVSGDIVSATPRLGTLGSNGGPTQTIALLAGSPAIGNGDPTVCASTTTPAAAPVAGKDQRGLPRPAARCAIGAFEPQPMTYFVGSTADSGAMDTLANCQSAGNTTCKLRDAIAYAYSGIDTITFNATGRGVIVLTNDGTHGTLVLATSVTIAGPTSGAAVVVDGGCTANCGTASAVGGVGVFKINIGVTAGLSNLTIRNGHITSSNGGGIANSGTLTVTNATLTANSTAGAGGGIYNVGTLTVTNSTLTGNSASASSFGGGIANDTSTLTVTNSTFSGNSAQFGGGIATALGTATVTNSTFSGNSASNNGGGILNSGGTLNLRNTIVATNTAPAGPDIGGAVTTTGNNLVSSTSGATGITNGTNGDIVSATPGLGPLQDAGGPTRTVPLLSGSPALGAGDAAACANMGGTAPVAGKDQRGLARPANRCAIGAFEPQQAAYTVGSTADTGATATLAECQSAGNTTCKLRDAIGYTSSGSDTIAFNATGRGVIVLTNDGTHGTLVLATSVTIAGPTSGATVILDGGCTASCGTASAVGGVGIFQINGGVTASIGNLTIRNGNAGSGNGGGILSNGTLTVANSTLSSNSATFGGGIRNNGTLMVTNSTLSGNSASGNGASSGGGIHNNLGTMTVTDSTLTGNTASFGGGFIVFGGTATMTNSTLTGNRAGFGGGAHNNGGTLTVTNSTLTGNTANGSGGGIYNNGGATTPTNAIVAGNTATGSGPDIHGAVSSGGHNLVSSTADSTGITNGTNGDIVNPNPLLGPLSNNGGPTQTISLLDGSPAIGAGDATICASTVGTAPVAGRDQRGKPRPTAHCDIGAVEGQLASLALTGAATTPAGQSYAVVVAAKSEFEATLPWYRGTVHLATNDPNAPPINDHTYTAADAGVSTFAVTLNTEGNRAVTATDTATPGVTGTLNVSVTGPSGFSPGPALVAVAPHQGPVGGGTTIAITGAGFTNVQSVTVGGVACTNVQVSAQGAAQTLTCATGAHAAGTVDVAVTTGTGTATLAGAYVYGVPGSEPGGRSGSGGGNPNPEPAPKPGSGQPGQPQPAPAARL